VDEVHCGSNARNYPRNAGAKLGTFSILVRDVEAASAMAQT
jgi:hypothetical protein